MASRASEAMTAKRRRIDGNIIVHGSFDVLPDEVVARILSFVPFPDLVLTMCTSLGNMRIRRLCRDHDVCRLLYFKKEWDKETARRVILMAGPRMTSLVMKGDYASSDFAVLALDKGPLLRKIECDQGVLSSSLMEAIGRSSSLRKFFVTTTAPYLTTTHPCRPSIANFISNVPNLKNLTILWLQSNILFDDYRVDLVTHIADNCKKLESVGFPYLTSLNERVLNYFLDKVQRTLELISFDGRPLIISSPTNLKHCHLLRYLYLHNAQELKNGGLLTIVNDLHRPVTNLCITWAAKITGQGFAKAFAGSRNLASLTYLALPACSGLDDVGLDAIARSCPYLRILYLAYCRQIGDKGVSSVLRQCQKLTELWLNSTSVTVEVFFVDGGDDGSTNFKSLKVLMVSEHLVATLAKLLPHCHVTHKLVSKAHRQ